jgi:hypothetical protein
MSISSQFFSELTIYIYISIFTFSFTIFICVLLNTFHFYSFHLHLQNTLPYFTFTFSQANNPEETISLLINHAFWSQNDLSILLEVLLPFLVLIRFPGSDQPKFLVYKPMFDF